MQLSFKQFLSTPVFRDEEEEPAGGYRDKSVSNQSVSSSVPTSILRAMQSTQLPRETHHQTWETLEALLDRKFDTFRQSIATEREASSSHSWSPQSKAALVSTLREVLGESPRSRFKSEQTVFSDASYERMLLQAIQETQNMINGIKRHQRIDHEGRSAVTSEEQISSVSSACPPSLLDSDLVEQIAKRVAEIIGNQISAETIIEQMVSRSDQQPDGQVQRISRAR